MLGNYQSQIRALELNNKQLKVKLDAQQTLKTFTYYELIARGRRSKEAHILANPESRWSKVNDSRAKRFIGWWMV